MAASPSTKRLFRVMCDDELADLMRVKRFRAGPNSFESAKWFCERYEDLAEWSRLFERWEDGKAHRRVVSVDIPLEDYARSNPRANHEGLGPAVCVDIAVLNTLEWLIEAPLP